ncbi:MAG: 30S ribosomal protein S6 [Chloroflexi bacterium]|nr:MAG: 30S ribosomal protein S6 [Chloroflexota bacterium]
MREYEVTIIIQPKLEESGRNELIEQVNAWLVGEEVTEENKPEVNHWGMRKMAYPIQKFAEGYYVHYSLNLDTTRVTDIERNFQYNENIIRYMVIRKEVETKKEVETQKED